MTGSVGRVFETNERHALVALAHPLAVVSLLVWILNDHVWKAEYGNTLTGKLSDAAGLIVFPIIVAALLSWWVRRPMQVAIATTIAIFGAINVFASAETALESVMSAVLASELTRDPTDLLLLPVLAVPMRLWKSAAARDTQVSKSWAHVLLGMGIAATLATSNDQLFDGEITSGVIMLTAEESRIEIPVQVTLADERLPASEEIWTNHVVAAFGTGPRTPNEAVNIVVEDRSDESDVVVIELVEPTWAPVEVHYEFYLNEVKEAGHTLNPFDEEEIVTTQFAAQTPPDSVGPVPISSIQIERVPDSPLRVSVVEWSVTIFDLDAPLSMIAEGGDTWGAGEWIAVATADKVYSLGETQTGGISPPASCTEAPCTFSIWVQADTTNAPYSVGLFGPAGITISRTTHDLERTRTTKNATVSIDQHTGMTVPVIAELAGPPLTNPIDQITQFVQVESEVTPLFEAPAEAIDDYSICCRAQWPQRVAADCCEWSDYHYFGIAGGEQEGELKVEVHIDQYALATSEPADLTIELGQITTQEG